MVKPRQKRFCHQARHTDIGPEKTGPNIHFARFRWEAVDIGAGSKK